MSFFSWSEEMSVQIASIDEQHKRLIDMANQFFEGLSAQKDQESIIKLVDGLLEYCSYHFSTEEKLMCFHDFKECETHLEEHAELINTVKEFKSRLEKGQKLLSVEVAVILKEWITNHILGTDKLYSEFLKSKGVK